MEKLVLDSKTRSKRAKWSWTDRNTTRANHITHVLNELEDWWPVTARQLFYRIISSQLVNDPCWYWKGKRVDIYKAVIRTLKWLRIDDRIPWRAITDEHRILTDKRGFDNREAFMHQEMDYFLNGYSRCVAQGQEYYIEVWIEKAALRHIVEPIADQFCRRVVVCRGYDSITFQTDFYERATEAMNKGETPLVLYFGDFDPSGVNMPYSAMQTFEDELDLCGVEYYRGGILPEHFQEIPADPVPIKDRDPRARRFIEDHGTTAYELDALHPLRLQELVKQCLLAFTDQDEYQKNKELEKVDIEKIRQLRAGVTDYVHRQFNP